MYKKQRVVQDRSHAIEAAIIRIMKTKKKLPMTQLMQEVLAALSMF